MLRSPPSRRLVEHIQDFPGKPRGKPTVADESLVTSVGELANESAAVCTRRVLFNARQRQERKEKERRKERKREKRKTRIAGKSLFLLSARNSRRGGATLEFSALNTL